MMKFPIGQITVSLALSALVAAGLYAATDSLLAASITGWLSCSLAFVAVSLVWPTPDRHEPHVQHRHVAAIAPVYANQPY